MFENMLNFHGTFGTRFKDGILLLIGALYGVNGGPWGGTRFPGNLRPVFPFPGN